MNPTIQPPNKNLPGIPIFPGRNTPLIQKGPPKNVKAQQEQTEKTEAAAADDGLNLAS